MPLQKIIKFSNLYKYSLDYITGLTRKNNTYKLINKLDKKIIGENLKNIRNQLGLTQKQIADECMIAQATYNGYESGKYLITSLTLYTICLSHKISIYEIIE